jgi:hypothetical protein
MPHIRHYHCMGDQDNFIRELNLLQTDETCWSAIPRWAAGFPRVLDVDHLSLPGPPMSPDYET